MGGAVGLFLYNVWWSKRRGAMAGHNPWGGPTLEWATSSPPRPYNFPRLPTVAGRDALWDQKPDTPVIIGLSTEKREALSTTIMDAQPEHKHELKADSIWPFLLAVVTFGTLLGVIFHPVALPIGLAVAFPILFLWFWRGSDPGRIHLAEIKKLPLEALPKT